MKPHSPIQAPSGGKTLPITKELVEALSKPRKFNKKGSRMIAWAHEESERLNQFLNK